jgi:hypothetical protein
MARLGRGGRLVREAVVGRSVRRRLFQDPLDPLDPQDPQDLQDLALGLPATVRSAIEQLRLLGEPCRAHMPPGLDSPTEAGQGPRDEDKDKDKEEEIRVRDRLTRMALSE